MKDAQFAVGDVIRIFTKDASDNKVHATAFEGIVISSGGVGVNKTFIVRKIGSDKVAIEKIFPLLSPSIEKIQVVKKGKVRRAKLYYLRKK